MKMKVRAEDFQVQEILRWDEDPEGEWTLYRVQKKNMTTAEAIEKIRESLDFEGVEISSTGPKDRQADTTQTIAVRGREIRNRIPGLNIKKIGCSASGLSAKNLLGHRYEIVARDLSHEAASWALDLAPKLSELGLPNYFDDQRFGSMRAGQGFPARDILLENFEQALMRMMGLPGKYDPPDEVSRKAVIRKHWGQWPAMASRVRGARAQSLVDDLARHPGDYVGALQRMPDALRASELLAYQAFLWNDAVARIVQKRLPPGALMQADSICDRHVFWKEPRYELQNEAMSYFKACTVPLVDSETKPKDDLIRRAINDSLEAEGLKWVCFKMRQLPKAFFKEVERPLILLPKNVTVGEIEEDEEHGGRFKLQVGFEVPTGSYATLVIKRLFQSYRFDNDHVLPRDWHRAIRFERSGEVVIEPAKRPQVKKERSDERAPDKGPSGARGKAREKGRDKPKGKTGDKAVETAVDQPFKDKPRAERVKDKPRKPNGEKGAKAAGPGDKAAKPNRAESRKPARDAKGGAPAPRDKDKAPTEAGKDAGKPVEQRPKRQRFKEVEEAKVKAPRRRGLTAKKSGDAEDAKPNFPWAKPGGAEDGAGKAPQGQGAEGEPKEGKVREWRKLKPKTKDKGYPKKFRHKAQGAQAAENPKTGEKGKKSKPAGSAKKPDSKGGKRGGKRGGKDRHPKRREAGEARAEPVNEAPKADSTGAEAGS